MTADPPSPDPGSAAPRCWGLVPCAGTGSRSGAALPKQYVSIAGRSLVAHALAALAEVSEIEATLVVLAPDDTGFAAAMSEAPDAPRCWTARLGGATRAATVAAGLGVLLDRGARPDDWVLVHDAARCLVRPAWIRRLIEACRDDPVGGLLAVPIADTVKQAATDATGAQASRVAATIDRSDKWLAQTPQMFRIGTLSRALAEAGAAVTDEASAIESLGLSPRLVRGAVENFKLTYPADFELAERLLRGRPRPGAEARAEPAAEPAAPIRFTNGLP
jgi:2-C-methyl-D-erythritol 4-phosphate cytidylyltransferase